jgi:hypothetical protein
LKNGNKAPRFRRKHLFIKEKAMKLRFLFVLMLGIVFMASTAFAEMTDGAVSFKIHSAALGIGQSAGEGILKFEGKEHPFTVSGFSVGDVGASIVDFTGYVDGLKNLSDFAGLYYGEPVGMMTTGGDTDLRIKNDKGVVMVLKGSTSGMAIKIGQQGLKVTLK